MKLKMFSVVLGLACLFVFTSNSLEARCRSFVSFNISSLLAPAVYAQPMYQQPAVYQQPCVVQAPCYTQVPVPQYAPVQPVVARGNPYYRQVAVAPAPVVVAPTPVYVAPTPVYVAPAAPRIGLSFGWSFR